MSKSIIEQVNASRSDDGRISLYDDRDGFMASFQNGKWVDDQVFRWTDLDTNFSVIYDESEILKLLTEARAALQQPLKTSTESKPKTA